MIESQEEDPKLEEVRRLRENTAQQLLLIVLKSNTINEVRQRKMFSIHDNLLFVVITMV